MTEQRREPPPTPHPCARCGYLADTSAGPLNFCPKCGLDLRPGGDEIPEEITALFVGQVVADRYRLTELLGEGGMGSVFRAEHVRMGKALAVKLLRGPFAHDEAAVQRFRAEARIVSRLSHPHTIAVFDFGELPRGEGFYLAMEYVPGRDLASVLRAERRLDEPRAVGIAEQLLGSLAEAHEAGVVHRDVKPANVMLMETREGDFVKVLDFGIAKLRDTPVAGDTTQGVIIGTPSYLAPEQARGDDVDGRADLYSVGALLYELVAGRTPFASRHPVAVLQAHLNEPPPPLRVVAPWVSEELAAVVHRALQKRPEDRFPDADAMRRALLRAAGRPSRELPSMAAAPGDAALVNRADFDEFERQLARLRRSRVTTPLLALAALALVGLALWRWPDIHAFLRLRAPGVAALVPQALRPPEAFDGREREPNDAPAQANPLPLPAGPDGRPGTGQALVRGHLGAKIDASTGDVDVYRVEVPDLGRLVNLVAEWSGAAPGEGIRGLDVVLTLNRDRAGEGGRRSAPLVAQSNRAGPGRPERLVARVEPGGYFLAVRERHEESVGPVEKPSDEYVLRVRLVEPRPGEESEPNDEPVAGNGYAAWRALAERNPLGEGTRIEGTIGPDDADTYAAGPRAPAEQVELVVLVPEPSLALWAQVWPPDQGDLASGAPERERFAEVGEPAPGELVLLRLAPPPRPGAPALVRVRSPGEGSYEALALGAGTASGAALRDRIRALATAGRPTAALELVAAFARVLPGAAGTPEALVEAGQLAESIEGSLRPQEIPGFERASRQLGAAIFELSEGRARYTRAFEARVPGAGQLAEAALARAALRVLPCTVGEVVRRGEEFLARFPAAKEAGAVRLRLARAREQEHWDGGGPIALREAIALYRTAARAGGPEAGGAARRAAELSRPRPPRPAVSRLRCE